jgi:NADPH:quinone reductase-like Zn-dependent oxidoreductase
MTTSITTAETTMRAIIQENYGEADRAGKLAPKPSNLTYAQAAAVPVSGLTALQAVRDRGHVPSDGAKLCSLAVFIGQR